LEDMALLNKFFKKDEEKADALKKDASKAKDSSDNAKRVGKKEAPEKRVVADADKSKGEAKGALAKKPSPSKPVKIYARPERYRVLVEPVVSEKSAYLSEENKYVFRIANEMNKVEVKKAIRQMYGVEPLNVNIIRVSGRAKYFRRIAGRTQDWKKAIVTLKKGDKIEVYEGV